MNPSTTGTPLASVPTVGAPSRRSFLVGTAALSGVGVLAACAPGGDESADEAVASGSADGTLVALTDVPVGGAIAVTTAGGDQILVAQPEEGTVVAFSAICTHQGCIVEPDGAELACPCHGSVYETATGENLSGPAPRPLDPFAVEVRDGQVVEA